MYYEPHHDSSFARWLWRKPWQPTTNNTTGVWWTEKSAVVLETSDQGHDIEISFPGLNRTLRIHANNCSNSEKKDAVVIPVSRKYQRLTTYPGT